ncbi:Transporter of the ATP-binding cassette (ABC) [Maudiozyma exigua]|uniref:Transporter of the ATP-binding cassette (ABC) n=1 Tax=Maudiozyma exigua TaxID=34358 RepID=A0A9P6W3U4_MAUEX|nr:Transporter of the ATP-binding cassette (ABC) [Kazachstania exigua]
MHFNILNQTNSERVWDYDDVTRYGRVTYVNFVTPFLIAIGGGCFIVFNIWSHYHRYNILHLQKDDFIQHLINLKRQSNTGGVHDESQALLPPVTGTDRNTNNSYSSVSTITNGELLKEKHFSIEKLSLTKLNGEPHGVPTLITRSFIEKTRVAIEFMVVITQLIIHTIILLNRDSKPSYTKEFDFRSSMMGFLLWLFLAVIVSLRLLNINQSIRFLNKYPGNMWMVSFGSYMLSFVASMVPFRSVLIHTIKSEAIRKYYISQFLNNGLLFLLLFFAPLRNNYVISYKTDKTIKPSPESVTSIASFICWGWLDKFVWFAHNHIVEQEDVWGLSMEDYSIFVLKKFKHYINSLKDKRSFSINLILFFKNYLTIQAFWAIIASFLTFFPTLQLKKILEYVDDQDSAPLSVAWLYVIFMFASKILVAIANGQALFFGRRVCIRMKSIIVSEIYSKALRKMVQTKSSKQNDSNDEELTPSGIAVIADQEVIEDAKDTDGDEESKESSAKLGQIINLMAVDAFKISEICAYLHSFVEAIVMTIIALVLLYNLIGFSAIVGAVVILAVLPINFKLANLIGQLQKKNLEITDKRIQKLNEALQAIRIIKFFSWEDNFSAEINEIREEELRYLIYRSVAWVSSSFFFFLTPILVTTSAFMYYIYIEGKTLTTPVAFTALSLFSLLRDPLDRLSDMLSYVIQSKVSLDRVQDFLEEVDTEKYNQLTIDKNGNKLAFEDATVGWGEGNQEFKLRNLNINFKIGKLNVVIGPTGSGKTSLLMALLGEMHLSGGKIIVPSLDARQDLVTDSQGLTNSIAYCSQSAWLLNDTVRNNILFNNRYDETRYEAVVEACSLRRDFEILKAGDKTEIGEKGITLSGGQKQRISLARALYSNSRHLLLDDCLSAVDAHTALWIYDNCITGSLMTGRTCILVSHNIALTLKNAELVVVLEDGQVKDQGAPLTLLETGVLGDDELVKSSILSRQASSVNLAKKNPNDISMTSLTAALNKQINKQKSGTADRTGTTVKNTENDADDGKLIQKETKAEGVVSVDVYLWYAQIFGGWKVILALASIFIICQAANISEAWWIREWVTKNTVAIYLTPVTTMSNSMIPNGLNLRPNINHMINKLYSISSNFVSEAMGPKHSTRYYLSIYFLIGLFEAIAGCTRTFCNFLAGIKASRRIFRKLLDKVLHSKLRFFDSTPIGRIMNRFSKDMEAIDQDLAPYMNGSFYSLVECVAIVILITFITPQFISIAILISIMYYLIGYFYMAGSRELKRLDSITKSPIYQHFTETLVGVTTIRAYGDEIRFIKENLYKIDENNKPFFYMWVANRWLSFRIDIVGAFVVFGAGIFILLNIKDLDSGLAGISLTYAISFTEGALWLVRFYAEVEMNMNSVERVKEYMDIEQEPYKSAETSHSILPPTNWPQDGKIEVSDLSLRYAPNLPKVIKNVSFVVDPQSKVGVVGRTGAGKSTIITALFRFLDPETGYVKIDNVDITSIDLNKLRRALTIIPQDPTLFAGTIKTNLDPYGEYNDDDIFAALRRVNLVTQEELNSRSDDIVSTNDDAASVSSENTNKFLNLESNITEGGNNLSQGQRQLLCLARSLLRSPKILLLDEATASIDYESDAKVQETIRHEFSESTILTIAHRLRSVIDYDKILVMDAGEVKEYDHPYSLLLNKNSLFYNMCEKSGELESLISLAKEAFVKKLNSK